MKKRSKKKTDKEERMVKLSPGFFANGQVFEQVVGGKYANGSNTDLVEEYCVLGSEKHTAIYQPLNRTVWSLAEKAVPYGSKSVLWKEIKAFIREHLFLPEEALYDVYTAWIFASWIREKWVTAPYLFHYGPIASGKTRGLEVLKQLCYRGILASNISSAALFRICELWHPTLLLDETEIYGNKKGKGYEQKAEVIHLLNSGYKRGELAIRAAPTANKGFEIKTFNVFGFKALAGTRGLAQALESRCIMVRMLKSHNTVRRLIDEEKATELRNKLLEFRFYALQCESDPHDQNDRDDQLSEAMKRLDFADGRLVELYSPLIAVSNEGREAIIEHAKNTFEIRQMEQQTTIEAEIVEILIKNDLVNEKNIAMTKEVAEAFNAERLDREKWKTVSIGWILKGLGFLKKHTNRGKGWFIEPNRLNSLARNYGIIETPLKVGHVGHVGHSDLDKAFKKPKDLVSKPYVCCLCQKGLPTDGYMTTVHEGKTCHLECYNKLKKGRKEEVNA